MIVPGRVVGGVVLCGKETSLVTLSLSGVNETQCEAISISETRKVKSLILEPALCKVNDDGSILILLHNPSLSQRRLKQGTYLTDFEVLPAAVGAINTMSSVPSTNTLETTEHKTKVKGALPAYSQITDYLTRRMSWNNYCHVITLYFRCQVTP